MCAANYIYASSLLINLGYRGNSTMLDNSDMINSNSARITLHCMETLPIHSPCNSTMVYTIIIIQLKVGEL